MLFRFGNFANLAKVGILDTSKAGERRKRCRVNQKGVSDRLHHLVVEPDSMDLAKDQALRPVAMTPCTSPEPSLLKSMIIATIDLSSRNMPEAI